MEAIDNVSSVGQAIDKVGTLIKSVLPTVFSPRPQFGFWFRGQINATWDVTPSIWLNGTRYDEGSMATHFQLLQPQHESTHATNFDWLTLMQHHGLPTRLVDWTENLLVALFFATWREGASVEQREKELGEDGSLFVMSARKLNKRVTDETNVAIPSGFHAVARATLTHSNSLEEWTRQFRCANYSTASTGARLFDRVVAPKSPEDHEILRQLLATPVAVFPSRRNARLVAQAARSPFMAASVPTAPRMMVCPHPKASSVSIRRLHRLSSSFGSSL